MTSQEYEILLQDERWLKRRQEILERDGYQCCWCGKYPRHIDECGDLKGDILQVHHKWYEPKKMPWEYQGYCLVTLCKSCHQSVEPVRTYFQRLVKAVFPRNVQLAVIKNVWLARSLKDIVEIIDEINWFISEGDTLSEAVSKVIKDKGTRITYAARWQKEKGQKEKLFEMFGHGKHRTHS